MPGRPITADNYGTWGKKIAQEYVQNRTDPTSSLRKIAQEHGLNPEQIRRTAEAINVSTYNDMMPHREGGDIRFPKAEPEQVISELNSPTKIAADLTDYLQMPPKVQPDQDRVLRAQFPQGYSEKIASEMEKTAQGAIPRPYEIHQMRELLWDLEKVAAELEIERMGIMKMTKESKDKFAEIVRRMVSHGYKIEDLAKAACDSRPDQREPIKLLFAEVISDLDHRGYFGGYKTASPVDPKLIANSLDKMMHGASKCTVINGKHPVLLQVDIVSDMLKKWWENSKGINITRDAITKAKKVINNPLIPHTLAAGGVTRGA